MMASHLIALIIKFVLIADGATTNEHDSGMRFQMQTQCDVAGAQVSSEYTRENGHEWRVAEYRCIPENELVKMNIQK